ncbi:MAG: ABC transporter permease [Acidimicrobiales bacterium]
MTLTATDLADREAPRRVGAPARRRGSARLSRKYVGRAATFVVSIVLGITIWGLVSLRYPMVLLPSPRETWVSAKDLWQDGTITESIWASSKRIISGWGLGLIVGIPVGLLMGRFQLLRTLFDPWVEFFRFIPPIAFVTLAVVWLGIGESSKVVLIFYTSVFIVTLNTLAGVLAVDEAKLRAAASLGAGRLRILGAVVLPSTVPYIVTGARLAMGNSFLTIVSAEIVAAQTGLGALIWRSRNYGRTEWVFVAIIVLGALGYCFDRILRLLARHLLGRFQVHV